MDIFLSEVSNKSSSFTFPVLPERIKSKFGTKYQSYDIMGKGTVKIPKGQDSANISWDCVFFGAAKKNEVMVRDWTSPAECVNILRRWMENKTVLRLLVTETNINYDVTIAGFEPVETGAFGNVDYSIEFEIYKELKIYTTSELKIAAFVKKTVPRATPAAPSSRTYTVVSGDNLWKIARKFYGGSGSNWKKIYDANSAVIEATARKHGKANSNNGWWIWAGEVFTIP